MIETQFSTEELSFLNSQGIPASAVFDARGVSKSDYRWVAKDNGCNFVYQNECRNGHRLKTRSGHCIQCDTRRIAFQSRHNLPSTLYLAYSEQKGLCKIGQTTDLVARIRKLRTEYYGGAGDWELLVDRFSSEAGVDEFELHAMLAPFRVTGSYYKDHHEQTFREVFRCQKDAVEAIFRAYFRRPSVQRSAARRLDDANTIEDLEERSLAIRAIQTDLEERLARHTKIIQDNLEHLHRIKSK